MGLGLRGPVSLFQLRHDRLQVALEKKGWRRSNVLSRGLESLESVNPLFVFLTHKDRLYVWHCSTGQGLSAERWSFILGPVSDVQLLSNVHSLGVIRILRDSWHLWGVSNFEQGPPGHESALVYCDETEFIKDRDPEGRGYWEGKCLSLPLTELDRISEAHVHPVDISEILPLQWPRTWGKGSKKLEKLETRIDGWISPWIWRTTSADLPFCCSRLPLAPQANLPPQTRVVRWHWLAMETLL